MKIKIISKFNYYKKLNEKKKIIFIFIFIFKYNSHHQF